MDFHLSGETTTHQQWGLRKSQEDLCATTIETDFGICVQMRNCSMVENFFEDHIYSPPLTLSWLSSRSRWHDDLSSYPMKRSSPGVGNKKMTSPKFVYRTQINYRRSVNLNEGRQPTLEQHRHCGVGQGAHGATGEEEREDPVRKGPKKMWIRHYYLTKGKLN